VRLLLIPLLFILVSATAAFVLGSRLEIPESFAEAVAWLRSFERWAWAVAMAVIIGDFLLPLPSTPALVCLGIVYGPWLGGLLGGVATTSAGLLAFGTTRALGRRGALYLVGEADLARAQRFYDRWGVYAVALGRALGGPLEWLVLIAGISGMPFARASAALLVGGFSAAFVTASLGDLAVDRPGLAIALVLILALFLAWLARRLLASTAPAAG
jgi:membrane-associated protein